MFLNKKFYINLGFYYLILSMVGGLLGFSFSIVLSVELNSTFKVFNEYFYYISLTSHGFIMVFYFLTLLSLSFYNYFSFNLSLFKNTKSSYVSNLIGYLLISLSVFTIIISLVVGEGVSSGWTLHTPLSNKKYNTSCCMDLLLMSLNIFLIYSVFMSILMTSNILMSFNNFESFFDVPMFIWSFLLTSFLNVFSMPSLFCVLCMLLLDSNFSTFYFDHEFGGSSILFQSYFWFFGHPEVYILMLPVFGLLSHSLKVICKGILCNSNGIIFSMLAVFMLSLFVFGHHMFTLGWGVDVKGFFMLATLMISLPTGVKIFSWLLTFVSYYGKINMVSLCFIFFILLFTFGGTTGVLLANYSLDVLAHDTYLVVGHFHTILASSAIFGFLSGLFLFYKNIFNFKEITHSFVLWMMFLMLFSISLMQLIFSLHLIGLLSVPSSVLEFPMELQNMLVMGSSSFVGIFMSMGLLMFLLLEVMTNKNEKNNSGM